MANIIGHFEIERQEEFVTVILPGSSKKWRVKSLLGFGKKQVQEFAEIQKILQNGDLSNVDHLYAFVAKLFPDEGAAEVIDDLTLDEIMHFVRNWEAAFSQNSEISVGESSASAS